MLAIFPYIFSAFLAASTSDSKLIIENCRFGEAYSFAAAECEIALTNTGGTPISISDVKPVTTGDSVEPTQLTLKPHEQAFLHVQLSTGNTVGNTQHKFHFQTDENGHEKRGFAAYGFIMSVLDEVKPELDFGVVDMKGVLPKKSIGLSSHDAKNFRVSKVLEKPDYLDVKIAPDGQSVIANVLPTAQWGTHIDFVKVGIETPQQQQAWIVVKSDIHGDVVPSSNPFDMGLMRFGDRNEFLIRLSSRSNEEFALGDLKLDGIVGDVKVLPCTSDARACRIVDLIISDQQPAGAIKGKIWLELPQFNQHMAIAVWGLILAKGVKVKSIEEMQAAGTDGSGKSIDIPKYQNGNPSDLQEALTSAVQQANESSPEGIGPLLKWTITNGESIYGFQIFRSDSEDGQFILVNAATIRANNKSNEPSAYQWRDNSAEPGKTYWYYIGTVDLGGAKKQLSSPQKVTSK